MVPNGEPTNAEIMRRLERFEGEVRVAIARMEGRLDTRVMSVDVYQAEKLAQQMQSGAIERRVGVLEEARTAMFKMVIGAFLGLVVNTIGILILYLVTKGPP